MNQVEDWRAVVGYEGYYEVSNLGRVRSLSRVTTQGHKMIGRVLKHSLNGTGGYAALHLAKDGENKRKKVHVLVLEAFIGPRPAGMQGCHQDDDPSNPALSNLRWGTPRSNHDDRIKSGNQKGEKHGKAKLTEALVREIKRLIAAGETNKAIATKLGIKAHNVTNIKSNQSWSWV